MFCTKPHHVRTGFVFWKFSDFEKSDSDFFPESKRKHMFPANLYLNYKKKNCTGIEGHSDQ